MTSVSIFTAAKVHCNLEGPFKLEISQNNYHGIFKKFIMEKSGNFVFHEMLGIKPALALGHSIS